jgi:hypothetical protein
VGGVLIRPDAVYRVAVSSHLASGGDGFVEVLRGQRTDPPEGAPIDADALTSHLLRLSKGGPVPAPSPGRFVFRDSD